MTERDEPFDARALPVYRHEEEIIEAVRGHQVVVVEGPTGSGKTTQVAQILARTRADSSPGGRNP